MRSLALFAALLFTPQLAAVGQETIPADEPEIELTLFLHSDWKDRPKEMALVEILWQEPMKSFVDSTTHRVIYDTDTAYVAGRYWTVPEDSFPVLIVSHKDGRYFFKSSKDSTLGSPQELYDSIMRSLQVEEEVYDQAEEAASGLRKPSFVKPFRDDSHQEEKMPIRDSLAAIANIIMGLMIVATACTVLFFMSIAAFVIRGFLK